MSSKKAKNKGEDKSKNKVIVVPGKQNRFSGAPLSLPPALIKPPVPPPNQRNGMEPNQYQDFREFLRNRLQAETPSEPINQPSDLLDENSKSESLGKPSGKLLESSGKLLQSSSSSSSSSSSGSPTKSSSSSSSPSSSVSSSSSSSSSSDSGSKSSSSGSSSSTSIGLGSISGTGISSLLINEYTANKAGRDKYSEEKLVSDVLSMLYPDYQFPKELSTETMLTMAMKKTTHQAILDMMKTRQNVTEKEIDETEFFTLRSLLNKQKGYVTPYGSNQVARLVPPMVPKVTTNINSSVSTIQRAPNASFDEKDEIKFTDTFLNENQLRDNKAYVLIEKDDNVYGRVILDDNIELCRVVHSKYFIILQAIRSLEPPPPTFDPTIDWKSVKGEDIQAHMKKSVEEVFTSTKEKASLVANAFYTARTDEINQSRKWFLLFWDASVRQMLDARNSKVSLDWFNKLIRLSDPSMGKAILTCFLDALNHYQSDLTDNKTFTIEQYVKFWDSEANEMDPKAEGYLPSEEYVSEKKDKSELRWSTLFQDMFKRHF